jgi:hypothetical protein
MSKKFAYKGKLFRKVYQLQKKLTRTKENPGHSEHKVRLREVRIRKLIHRIKEK